MGRGVRDQHITSSTCDISELEDIYQTCIESPYYHAVFPAENPSSFFTYYHTMIRVKDKNPQALVKIQVDTSFLNKLLWLTKKKLFLVMTVGVQHKLMTPSEKLCNYCI